jgi:hypothetical protein
MMTADLANRLFTSNFVSTKMMEKERCSDMETATTKTEASDSVGNMADTHPASKDEEGQDDRGSDSPQPALETDTAIHGPRLWLLISGMMLGVYLVGLDTTMLATVGLLLSLPHTRRVFWQSYFLSYYCLVKQ